MSTQPVTAVDTPVCEPNWRPDVSLLEGQLAPPVARATPAEDTIVYLNFGGQDLRTQIRLIQADGSNDRALFEVPESVASWYRPWAVNWSPDGSEISFTSGHLPSYFMSDVYAISSDGQNLRRITNPPLPERLAGYPYGRVTAVAYPYTPYSGRWWIYIEGAAEAATFVDDGRYGQYLLNFDRVADYGEGIEQRAVVRNLSESGGRTPPWCTYGVAARTDVQVCEQTMVGPRLPELGDTMERPCLYADRPGWTGDGSALIYLLPRTVVNTTYRLVRVASHATRPGQQGQVLGPVGNVNDVIEYSTLSPQGDRLLIRTEDLLLVDVEDPTKTTRLPEALCHPTGASPYGYCDVRAMDWHPDGHGFYFLAHLSGKANETGCAEQPCAILGFYDIEQGQASELGVLGTFNTRALSVSPDLQRALITVGTASAAVRDLWMYDLSSGDMTLFKAGAAGGKWAPRARRP